MKSIIFIFTLLLTGVMISGNKQSSQNKKTEILASQIAAEDLKIVNKPDIHESKADQKSLSTKKTAEDRPRILLMLNNETGLTKWSPSLWWNYEHSKTGQPGC
jgi:hypothetical protein